MKLFRRKKDYENVSIQADRVEIKSTTPTDHTVPTSAQARTEQSMVEIVAADSARHEVIKEAKEVNRHLKNLLVENGFTIKIYLAAGGKHKKEKEE